MGIIGKDLHVTKWDGKKETWRITSNNDLGYLYVAKVVGGKAQKKDFTMEPSLIRAAQDMGLKVTKDGRIDAKIVSKKGFRGFK